MKLINIILILIILIFILLNNKSKLEYFSGNNFSDILLNKNLLKITNVLNKEKITNWFLGYGTLLGIIRNNSCVNNDDDIDIIIDIKNKININKIIKKYNYKIIVNKNNFYKIELQQNLPTVDFYFATVNKNNDFHDTWEKVVWSKCKPFIKKKWKNTTLNIPNNYETKLINRYGKNWRIPKNNYKGPKPRKKIL